MAHANRSEHRTPDGASEALPVDVFPASNGEFVPPPPTARQRTIMARAEAETERYRRRFGMNRREFVRSAAAMAIGFWAIDSVGRGRWGSYASAHNTSTTDACDLEWGMADGDFSLANKPGEFIFDVQSHHVDPEGMWRVTNPAFHAAFATLWSQSGPQGTRPQIRADGTVRGFGGGELDPIKNLSRFHYMKELFLDSSTNMTVLSAVPTAPDDKNPLPIAEAAATVRSINDLAGNRRSVLHGFVMPNRGSAENGTDGYGLMPLNLQEELDLMTQRVTDFRGLLAGWKIYPAWGDVPYASGWFLDAPVGDAFLNHVEHLANTPEGQAAGLRSVVAIHKGFALPGFDQRAAAPRDVGPAALSHPGVDLLIYHSGHDLFAGGQSDYDDEREIPDDERSVDAFIRSLRRAGVHAHGSTMPDPGAPPTGHLGDNAPNVYAELGSVWRDYIGDPDSATHLLGKLIRNVGPRRVIWGTDSLWYGSPQREIAALRRLRFTDDAKSHYGLPHGLEGDIDDPQQLATTPDRSIRNGILGRNAARAYGIDVESDYERLSCDQVNAFRESFVTDPLTERERSPYASNTILGPRNAAELAAERNGPWAP
ncbi:MAG TPA: amidohydrolase family protein [Acidimicrobiales bacterium]